jgi:hypothetical protein
MSCTYFAIFILKGMIFYGIVNGIKNKFPIVAGIQKYIFFTYWTDPIALFYSPISSTRLYISLEFEHIILSFVNKDKSVVFSGVDYYYFTFF